MACRLMETQPHRRIRDSLENAVTQLGKQRRHDLLLTLRQQSPGQPQRRILWDACVSPSCNISQILKITTVLPTLLSPASMGACERHQYEQFVSEEGETATQLPGSTFDDLSIGLQINSQLDYLSPAQGFCVNLSIWFWWCLIIC